MLLKPSEMAIAWMSLLYYCILLFFGCCIRGLNLGTLHSNMWQHSGYVNRHVFLPLCICATPEEDPLSFYGWPWSEGCVAAACFSQWLNVFFFFLTHWVHVTEKSNWKTWSWTTKGCKKRNSSYSRAPEKKMSLLVLPYLVSEKVHTELPLGAVI